MLCDLHIHSRHSDGTRTPQQITQLCLQQNIRLFSITDHNLLSAYPEALDAAKQYGLTCITGVEVDCILNGRCYHVLGYGVDTCNQPLLALLRSARQVLDEMSDRLIAAIELSPPQIGEAVSMQDYLAYRNDSSRGGWKGLNYLIDRKLAHDFDSAMALYSRYHITYEKSAFPSMEETCRAIVAAGGTPILAHPSNYFPFDDKLEENLLRTVHAGVQGIECYYPAHSEEYRRRCVAFCQEHQLFITCGGDSHGEFQKEIDGIRYEIGAASVDSSKLYLR
jgi:predicted metal-dependent phosphoesterase TrpH